jgi:hypothetical protein
MEFSLTDEQKAASLESTLWAVKNEMFSVLLTSGMDPDDFDPFLWEVPALPTNGNIQRLIELVASFKLINRKINETA